MFEITPYLPQVTLEQIRALVAGDRETYTTSPLVNAVAEVLSTSTTRESQEIADRLAVDKRKLSIALELETGYTLKDLIIAYRLDEIRTYMQQHPDEPNYKVAEHFGFSTGHAFWRFFQMHTGCNPDGTPSEAPKVDNYSRKIRKLWGWKQS